MRYFIAVLFLMVPILARGAICPAGQYLDNGECKYCIENIWQNFYCPGDDTRHDCPSVDGINLQQLLITDCGLHDVPELSPYILTWGSPVDPLELQPSKPTNCFLGATVGSNLQTREGTLLIESRYNAVTGEYWTSCYNAVAFWSANPGYYLSTYKSTSFHDWYYYIKPCTNAHPAHSHYSGPGTPDDPVKTGGRKDYNDCPWECDDGYILQDGECVAALCPAGQYLDNGECKNCEACCYCPGDDIKYICPPDTTEWNKLFVECGYHPLTQIQSKYVSSHSSATSLAYKIGHCRADSAGISFKEGDWEMQQLFNSERGDYWNGCDKLTLFYSANAGYYLSQWTFTTHHDFYNYIKPCTNEHPENSHYSGPGTPDEPVTGGKTDYNDCPWACDDGYGLHDGACLPLCAAGATEFHVGDFVFNIYKDKLTTPAINIGLSNGTVCYVPLVPGVGKGALNVDYKGVIYHTSD